MAKSESGEEEWRGAGPGEWGLAVRVARPSPSRSRPALRRVAGDGTALHSAVYTRGGEKRLGPGLRPMAQGLCRVGTRARRWLRPGAFLRQGQGSRPACPGSRSGSGRLLRVNMTHPGASPRRQDPSWPSGDPPGPHSPGLSPSSCLLVLQATPESHVILPSSGQEVVLIWGLLSVVGLPHRECVLGQGSGPGGLHPAGPPSPCPALAYLA
ncbi:uncharacterized protein LOC121104449 [Ursus maritimus]|uniref:Uncharacterized protein LOC121104449 n=1 Tax=Ursus maritimus TaxID=29073 RepID=A0A8M1GFZ2_URSMA|nr:uncharacterized protein LOC121104449 [Ursus maritimus]